MPATYAHFVNASVSLFHVLSGFLNGVLVSWTVPDKFTHNFFLRHTANRHVLEDNKL